MPDRLSPADQAVLDRRLIEAAWAGDVRRARRLVRAAGADVTLPSRRDGVAPVDHARAKGFAAIESTLRATLRSDERRREGMPTPWRWRCATAPTSRPGTTGGAPRCCSRDLRPPGRGPLAGGARGGRRVVRTGIGVNHVNDLGWTALLEAVILGDGGAPYQEIVRILLDAGADPSIPDRDGVTALEHAQRTDQREVARILRRVR